MKDPVTGWLARKDGIRAGVDNVRVAPVPNVITLGELMARFLAYKMSQTKSGDLSKLTLGGYLREVRWFVEFFKAGTPVVALKPEHFTAYMKHLVDQRKLGRFARKRVRTYLSTFLRYGAKNDLCSMPNTGIDWIAPATDPDSMRLARARSGIPDFSSRILTGEEIDRLLARSQPAFKAMILLGVNCGLGPADVGRLTWNMLDLQSGRLVFPRPKTGAMRVGHLWKKTREALRRVRTLKRNRLALVKQGEGALVFITRKGLPYYREREVHTDVEVGGQRVKKLVGVVYDNPIGCTFGRKARELGLKGVSFYRLRHTFKTLGKKARDRETLDLMMGHKNLSTGKVYDHELVVWRRVRRVARAVRRGLWPQVKPREETPRRISASIDEVAA